MCFHGRRRLVERTTARCCRSACTRPEAGPCPSSASGRARSADPTACGGLALSAYPDQARVAYRVYGRDEFLAQTEALTELDVAPAACSDDTARSGPGRKRRTNSSGFRNAVPIALAAGAAGFIGLALATATRQMRAARRTAASAQLEMSTPVDTRTGPRGRAHGSARRTARAGGPRLRRHGDHRVIRGRARDRSRRMHARFGPMAGRAPRPMHVASPGAAASSPHLLIARPQPVVGARSAQPGGSEFGFER